MQAQQHITPPNTLAESSTATTDEVMPVSTIAHQDLDSGLERLPPEIRRHLLSILDLMGLKALVRASPTFHEQYLFDRRFLLCSSLKVTLGSTDLDAYTVQKSSDRASNTPEYLTGLLKTWRGRLPQRSSWRLECAVTEDEAIYMVSFFFRTVEPVARCFIRWALDELETLTIDTEGGTPESQPEPSSAEWQRCLRAVYLFQLLCQVSDPTTPALSREHVRSNVKAMFLSPEPWEVNELVCVYEFAESVYEKVFDEIKTEVHPDNPIIDDQDLPPTPDWEFEFDYLWSMRKFVEGMILHGGLALLKIILMDNTAENNDHDRLMATVQRRIVSSYIPLAGYAPRATRASLLF